MNASRHTKHAALLQWALLIATAGHLSAAATNKPPTAAATAAAVPAPSANTSTNRYISTFDSNGRDPFFPRSTRLAAATDSGNDSRSVVVLVLKGFSGSAKRRFAIINDRTFAAGEENEVLTASGRLRVRCVEIRADSAVVTIGGGEKIELRLPSRF